MFLYKKNKNSIIFNIYNSKVFYRKYKILHTSFHIIKIKTSNNIQNN